MAKHKGFTFVEIALFLAVTAALFIGIALGMQNSIFQQRYNDTVQNFFEFMRSIYSKVSNPQSPGKGNSTEAIYGKLVVFGETKGILGEDIEEGQQPIFTYDVIGDASDIYSMPSGNLSTLLYKLEANVVRVDENQIAELVSPEKYEMRWQSELQDIGGGQFKGSILVVRHPRSGAINTLVMEGEKGVIEANLMVKKNNEGGNVAIKELLRSHFGGNSETVDNGEEKFGTTIVDFCVSPYAVGESGPIPRQNIRILANARNASSVQLIDLDSDNTQDELGNKCKN